MNSNQTAAALEALLEKRKHLEADITDWTAAHAHAVSAEDRNLEREKQRLIAEIGTWIKPEDLDHKISRQIEFCIQALKSDLEQNGQLTQKVRAALDTMHFLENGGSAALR